MFLLHLQHLSLHHPHYLLCLGVDACRLALLLVALHQHVHHMLCMMLVLWPICTGGAVSGANCWSLPMQGHGNAHIDHIYICILMI
jgi:hypothetical protein